MKNLDQYTTKIIYSYLKNNDLYNLLEVQLNYSDIIKEQIKENIILKKKYWNHLRYYQYFLDTIFPIELIKTIPIIKYKKHFVGPTQYMDRIKKKDLTSPIMIGIDHYRRPFVSIRYSSNIDKLVQYESDYNFTIGSKILTLFQRYTDTKKSWCKAGSECCYTPLLHQTSTLIKQNEFKLITRNIIELLNDREVTYPQYNYRDELIQYRKMKISLV